MNSKIILAINPGSTSTKIAIFNGPKNLFQKNIIHSVEDLAPFNNISEQYNFRKEAVLNVINNNDVGVKKEDILAVVGRGGVLKPVPSGVFEVNEAMINDLRYHPVSEHASNLGGLIAYDIAKSLPNARAFIADPVVVDELEDIARIAGHPEFKRISIFHALNQKAVARYHAKTINKKYEDLNLIVAHLGGGITVGAHRKGRVIDVNQGLDGEGPFSPERSGTLPMADLVRLCFSGKYTKDVVLKMITGKGGMVAYLNTNNMIDVEARINAGDDYAKLIYEAMAYQIAKEIGAMVAVMEGEIDAILITGGVAYNKNFVNLILKRVQKFGSVILYPGEDEMEALAMNGLMVLNGEAKVLVYS